jgi:SAM-dependent methyltransferase/uncharacterized protein YbaR (Trm112 family)
MAKPLPDEAYDWLRCVCDARGRLQRAPESLTCTACGAVHPVVDGVPVILDRRRSVFDPEEIISSYRSGPPSRPERAVRAALRFVPPIGSNLAAGRVSTVMRDMLSRIEKPNLLVVGGGDAGAGLEGLLDEPRYTTVESDIYFGPRCNLIADGHDLPFASGSFDAVICQAVLEHVVRPHDCIAEMHRVLKPHGVVFIDVPFLFPVHMGAHDFTRFTLGGLRAACRRFDELEAGVSGGPGQAVAWMILYDLRALSSAKAWSACVLLVAPWFLFWLQYIDKLLVRRPQASDVASGLFFLGTRSDRPRSDKEVLESHWSRRPSRAQAASSAPAPARKPLGAALGGRGRSTGGETGRDHPAKETQPVHRQ